MSTYDKPLLNLFELIDLGYDWDGYGAQATSPRAIVHAALFLLDGRAEALGAPAAVATYPNADGDVSLEWGPAEKDNVISIRPGGHVCHWWIDGEAAEDCQVCD